MDTAEILKKVRQIEIQTNKLVSETFAGEYLSAFKGQGIEFAEVREYTPGDDIRSIDWNVTARTGIPYIKKYNEERELTLMIACDVSASQRFGSADKLKQELAAELSALFAFSATSCGMPHAFILSRYSCFSLASSPSSAEIAFICSRR